MKSKRIIITLVMALALMLALAISSYAATITLYSGADNTSESTTHNGALTLTGNTEANETVTVYFTDDGRAWKAGETVSFTKDTNLYTIECAKISNYTEWKNASAGNYILTADMDFNFEFVNPNGGQGTGTRHNAGGPMKPANGTTTRVFFNGHTIATGNCTLFDSTDISIYLLGDGKLDGYWGGNFLNVKCTATSDCKIVVGKGISAKSDWTQKCCLLRINDYKTTSKLDFHFYGSYTSGQLVAQNSTPASGSYNIYLHDGCTLNLPSNQGGGRLIATATSPIANVVIYGGTYTFTRSSMFADGADLSRFSMDIQGGSFTFTDANAMPTFVNAINSEKKANYINELSFNIVCKECEYEKTLAEFVDFATDFSVNLYCPNCGSSQDATTVEKIFTAKGYSLSPDGKAISAGYTVNHNSLAIYEEIMGATSYGIVIANADAFEGKTFFDESNKVNTEKSVQVDIDRQYSVFDCALYFDTTSNSTLKLVICAYVIGSDGSAGFVQHTTGESVAQGAIAGGSFKFVTLDTVVALQPATTKEY
ncbi:MAG: hypothetical protein IJZ04_05105 [Clostridia bacterium]|nr:hypothetical protein [Clostridia bacterium]